MRTNIPRPAINQAATHFAVGFSCARFCRIYLVFAALAFNTLGCAQEYATAEEAAKHPDFAYQGEYVGEIILAEKVKAARMGIQLAARGDGKFEGFIYPGGLPGDGWTPEVGGRQPIMAKRIGGHVQTEPFGSVTFRHEEGVLIARDSDGAKQGVLARVHRTSPTEGKSPPEQAVVLFDGTNLDKWRDGARMVESDLLAHGARSADDYGDMYLHLEFKTGFMPDARGERRNNSGVYIQDRYEVQILDSFGMSDHASMNAALYREKAPMLNMSFPPLQWQTYDILFRAPRFDDAGKKTENARITIFHNGMLVHDDLELKGGTGRGGTREEVSKEHLFLQNHTGPVHFRNVWLVEDLAAAEKTLQQLKAGPNP